MSLHASSVPVFVQMLEALSGILKKAEAHAAARKIPDETMLGLRLAPDMFALARQVQITCDFAKNTAGRLAGQELPRFPDEEKTFAELQARVAKTVDYVKGLPEAAFEGAGARDIGFPIAGKPCSLRGDIYLERFALPNFHFHATAAYAILRSNGVDIGKGDYLGQIPGLDLRR
jgi:hypothetical protein